MESIVNDLAFTQGIEVELETLQDALAVVQTLDPPGVGARDLKECLLLQVVRKQHEKEADDPRQQSLAVAKSLLETHYDAFAKKHFEKLQTQLDLTEEGLKEALADIQRKAKALAAEVEEKGDAIRRLEGEARLRADELEATVAGNEAAIEARDRLDSISEGQPLELLWIAEAARLLC